MADTAIAVTAGSGTNVDTRTEGTNGNHRQVIVIGDPATNAGVAPVDATTGLAVNVTNASLTVASHAVTNAGTFAVQDSRFATEDAAASADPVGPVLLAVRRDALSTSEVSADGDNIALKASNKGKLHVAAELRLGDTVSDTGSGTGGSATQRVIVDSSQLAALATTSQAMSAGFQLVGLPSDQVKIPVHGNTAHDGADADKPIKIGGRARSSEVSAVSNNDVSDLLTDLVGKLIVLPYANPENFVSGAITSAMTGTTSTSLIAAPASGLRNYITTIIVSNAHATVGTDIIIQDGSDGTTLLTIPAAAVYGGAVINLPVPLRQPTTATAIFCANVTTGASTKVSAVGYKGV